MTGGLSDVCDCATRTKVICSCFALLIIGIHAVKNGQLT